MIILLRGHGRRRQTAATILGWFGAGAALLLTLAAPAQAQGVRKTGEVVIATSEVRLLSPKGICFDPLRNLLIVANSGADQVVVADPLGSVHKIFGRAAGIRAPRAVAVSGRGTLFVAEEGSEEIKILGGYGSGSPEGRALDLAAFRRNAAVEIVALHADRGGALFAADRANRQVLAFDPDLRLLWSLPIEGIPTDVWSAGDEIFVADPGYGEIRVYGRDGRPRRTLGRNFARSAQPVRAAALVVGPDKTVWVAEEDGALRGIDLLGNSRVVLPAAVTGLMRPEDLAIDPQGNLFVLDSGGSRIMVFRTSGF